MQLPEALQPWREWLNWFAPELWPGFSDLLGRIDPLLGPLRGVQLGGTPEPEGLSDLQRRGPYERLLTSEWLLADELPDEFLRRAATGEHLFLAPEQRARRANRRVVVLFDAGPLQWGAPRLVHLALMILLARRARDAGGQLHWGIVQQPGVLAELDSAAALKRLLQARGETAATAEHWQAWQACLSEQTPAPGECWAVGLRQGPEVAAPTFTHRVQVQRTLDGEGIQLDLHGVRHQRLRLPMPHQGAGQRLLNGDFQTRAATASAPGKSWRAGLSFAPVISPSGSHVAVMLLDEPGSLVFRVPAPGQKKPSVGRKQLWYAGFEPVAADFVGNAFAAALSNANHLHFWKIPALRAVPTPGRDTLLIPSGTATLLPCVSLVGKQLRLYCLDTLGQLVYFGNNERFETSLTPFETHVLGMGRVGQESLAYVKKERERLFLTTLDSRALGKERFLLGAADNASRVLFAGSPGRRQAFVACAVYHPGSQGGEWRVHNRADDALHADIIRLTGGHDAIGLLHLLPEDATSLLLMGGNQRSVCLYSEQNIEVLFTSSSPMVRHSFCPLSGMLAVLTAERELKVYSVRQRQMRLQVMCNQAQSQEATQ
ncbi:MAG: hypothetical protein PW845_22515 [Pseudomonas sp.]|nr:hypothetical protein [Pseudomonas sp.]